MPTIKFKLQEVPHPKSEEAKDFYPILASWDKLSAEDFTRLIHERCSLTEGDVMNVLINAANILSEKLSNGTRVEVPELGTFAPSIVSDEPIHDLDDKLIARRLRVDTLDFTPRTSLMYEMRQVSFHRADQMVKRRAVLTDQQLMECVQALCVESPTHSFDRQTFQQKLGIRPTKACGLLRELTEKGVLLKQGKHNSPYYTLNKE